MENDDEIFYGEFNWIENIASAGLWIAGMIVQGFILAQLWAWFIMTKFNAPLLSIPEALGISLLITYFKPREVENGKRWEFLIQALVNSAFYLIVGYILFRLI